MDDVKGAVVLRDPGRHERGERWRRQVAVSSDADAADAGIPMGTRGHVATYEWYGGEIAVDVATGADRPTGENRSFSVVTAPSGEQFLYSSGAKEQGAVCAVEDLSKCVDISGSLPDDALVFDRAVVVDGRPQFVMLGSNGIALVDPKTGEVTARLPLPETGPHEFLEPVEALEPGPALVFGASESGRVQVLDPRTGELTVRGQLPGWHAVSVPPATALLFVRADQNDATATALAAFVPAVSPTSLVLPGATLASAAPAGGAGRPSQIPACPAGTRELAWATFSSGWILVCRIDGRPTVWVSSTGGVQRQSNSPEWDPGLLRFTTSFDDGSSGWLSWAPATAGWSGPDGAVTSQESVGVIWFVDLGGARATEGSFGVRAPDATADDQVRYLSAILEKSAATRADLASAVVAVRSCKKGAGGYAHEVEVIDAVTLNRRDLLEAVRAAPVDKVPQGAALVSELGAALSASKKADEAYARWARAIHAQGCGAASEAEGAAMSAEAGRWKTAFAARWNSVIAPAFGVSAVTREKL